MIRGVEITVEVIDNNKEFFWKCECGAKSKEVIYAPWQAIMSWKDHLSTDFSPRTRGCRAHSKAAAEVGA